MSNLRKSELQNYDTVTIKFEVTDEIVYGEIEDFVLAEGSEHVKEIHLTTFGEPTHLHLDRDNAGGRATATRYDNRERVKNNGLPVEYRLGQRKAV